MSSISDLIQENKIQLEEIRKDFPSFCDFDHFDDHWKDNFTEEIPAEKLATASRFLQPLFDQIPEKEDLVFLDAGCGDGMHITAINQSGKYKNARKVAFDISLPALAGARKRDAEGWEFLHADVGNMPFKDKQFDTVFSYGVLAYTDDPFASFQEMVRVAKDGGLVGVWIYPKLTGLGGFAFGFARKWCQITGNIGTQMLANAIVPFLGILPTTSNLNLGNASWAQCREIVMVNIAPTQLFFPTRKEIEAWFEKMNIDVVFNDPDETITIWGRKR